MSSSYESRAAVRLNALRAKFGKKSEIQIWIGGRGSMRRKKWRKVRRKDTQDDKMHQGSTQSADNIICCLCQMDMTIKRKRKYLDKDYWRLLTGFDCTVSANRAVHIRCWKKFLRFNLRNMFSFDDFWGWREMYTDWAPRLLNMNKHTLRIFDLLQAERKQKLEQRQRRDQRRLEHKTKLVQQRGIAYRQKCHLKSVAIRQKKKGIAHPQKVRVRERKIKETVRIRHSWRH